jgi:hypothetical protein
MKVPDWEEAPVGISFKNPWWVVVGAVIGLFVCNGPVLAFTFGVFLKPLMADAGLDTSPRGSACPPSAASCCDLLRR